MLRVEAEAQRLFELQATTQTGADSRSLRAAAEALARFAEQAWAEANERVEGPRTAEVRWHAEEYARRQFRWG
eukprot:14950421-Alexandrium_andersonii.AAC.1